MEKMDIEIPADAKTVTLELKEHCPFTLRSLLPQIRDEVELVVKDVFGTMDSDMYRLHAASGDSLLHKLMRSRIVEGESLLDLMPDVRLVSPQTTVINGSPTTLVDAGYIQLWVCPPVPDEED